MSIADFPPRTAIIIPTYSNTEGLNHLLHDITVVYGKDVPVIVVNNGRTPLDVKADVINQGKNTGFARAVNDGAQYAIHKYKTGILVILNDDISFDTDWISECILCMSANHWDITAPVLMRGKMAENYGYRVLKKGKVDLVTQESDTNIDGLTAAALIMHAPAFVYLKGFDERYFAYLEDVDMFLRIKKTDLKFGLCRKARVYHYGHRTSKRMPIRKAWWDLRNWIFLIQRHWTREDLRRYGKDIVLERLRNLSGFCKAFFARP